MSNIIKNIFYWAKEIIYFFAIVILLNLVGLFYRPKTGSFSEDKLNVVLVHGIMTKSIIFVFLRKKLRSLGYNVVMFEYGFGFDDITKNAKKLEDFLFQNKKGEIILVGHSLGGVIILEAKRLSREVLELPAITMCSPVRGAPLFWVFFWSKAGRQFNPQGEFIKRIREFSPNYKNTVFVKSAFDGVVFDGYSCFSENACVTLDVKGHTALPFEVSINDMKKIIDQALKK